MILILFILGISITLDVIFGLIIYFYLISDSCLFSKKKKKEELYISKLNVEKKNVDTSFWG